MADGVGVDAEGVLGVEEAGAELDGTPVGGIHVGDLEVEVQLLLDVGGRPRRGDEAGGPLEGDGRATAGACRVTQSPSSAGTGQSSNRA